MVGIPGAGTLVAPAAVCMLLPQEGMGTGWAGCAWGLPALVSVWCQRGFIWPRSVKGLGWAEHAGGRAVEVAPWHLASLLRVCLLGLELCWPRENESLEREPRLGHWHRAMECSGSGGTSDSNRT